MGKRSTASRKEEMAQMPKASNPSSESEEPQPEEQNPSSKRTEEQHESANPSPEKTNSKLGIQGSTKSYNSRKKPKHSTAGVRRSLRILNCGTPVQSRDIEPVIENVTISDSEKEDEQPLLEEPLNEPFNGPNLEEELNGPTLAEKNMEEKVDYLIQLLETLNSKEKKRSSGFSESPDFRYKSMYIESQKKIETLKNENQELSVKLEVALGKLEGYEKGTHAFSEVMEKMKDVILVSSLSKATERVLNVASQTIGDALSPQDTVQHPKSAAKRKKQT